MKNGIVFSNEEGTNELKVSRYNSDSLTLMLSVPLFNYDTSEFTEDASDLASELGFKLTVSLIHTGSPMDAVQSIWLDKKLEEYAENSDIDLDELLKKEIKMKGNIKGLIDEELKAKLRNLAPELSDSEFEALFISQKVINDAIKNTEQPRIEDVTFIKGKQLQSDTIDKRFSPKKRLKEFIYPSID